MHCLPTLNSLSQLKKFSYAHDLVWVLRQSPSGGSIATFFRWRNWGSQAGAVPTIHRSPTSFLLSSFLSPKRVIKHSFGYREEEQWYLPLSFLFSSLILRCQVWCPGQVWQESHCLHKTGKSLPGKSGKFLAFPLKTCVWGLGLKSHFFQETLPGEGVGMGAEGQRGVLAWLGAFWCLYCLNFDTLVFYDVMGHGSLCTSLIL